MDGKMKPRNKNDWYLAWAVFLSYGLRLQEDETIQTERGKVVGKLLDVSTKGDVISVNYQSFIPLTYISTEITISRSEPNGS